MCLRFMSSVVHTRLCQAIAASITIGFDRVVAVMSHKVCLGFAASMRAPYVCSACLNFISLVWCYRFVVR